MPTKKELHFCLESDLEFGLNQQPLKFGTDPHPRYAGLQPTSPGKHLPDNNQDKQNDDEPKEGQCR